MIFAIASHMHTFVIAVQFPPRLFAVAIGTAQVCSVNSEHILNEGSDAKYHGSAIMKTSVNGPRELLGF